MRNLLVLTAVTLAAGCAEKSAPIDHQASPDETIRPYCAFDLSEPEVLKGELIANDVPHLDCVAPEGGADFSVGFAHDGWRAVLHLPRASARVGETIAFGDGRVAMLYQGKDGYCTDWDGEVVWLGDVPSWGIIVTAYCKTAPLAVVGAWSGS
ncbi:MAG: hypothetical protein JWN44_130 [Myxococcales bacterium]|nr:hypothetical protein [Myxococcales bacterium]